MKNIKILGVILALSLLVTGCKNPKRYQNFGFNGFEDAEELLGGNAISSLSYHEIDGLPIAMEILVKDQYPGIIVSMYNVDNNENYMPFTHCKFINFKTDRMDRYYSIPIALSGAGKFGEGYMMLEPLVKGSWQLETEPLYAEMRDKDTSIQVTLENGKEYEYKFTTSGQNVFQGTYYLFKDINKKF